MTAQNQVYMGESRGHYDGSARPASAGTSQKLLDTVFPNLRDSPLPVSQGSGQLPLPLLANRSNPPPKAVWAPTS
jgi:hypothetical protein